jgi:uncharacterized protein (UPF0332 family)
MTKKAKKHPPKNKHSNKPRPEPVTPLTESQRLTASKQEFRKALVHLLRSETIVQGGVALSASIHLNYYAMYHCVIAAILAAGGVGKNRDAPKSHRTVMEHFNSLAIADEPDLPRILNDAFTDRETEDYGMPRDIGQKDANERVAAARNFIEACRRKWALTEPS